MPGLLRGVARVAVVSGTATAVSNRVSRRQATRWQEQGQAQPGYLAPREASAPPPPPPPPAAPDPIEQLSKLGELHASGVLTDEEFAAEKAKILG